MVAPLRPLITPLTLSLCAAAAPQNSRNATKPMIILNALRNLFLFMFIPPPQLFWGPLLNPGLAPGQGTFCRPGYAALRVGAVLSSRWTGGLAAGTTGCEPFTMSCALRSLP